MRARGSAADAQFRLLGHLHLGDQAARGRIPPGELDAGCFPDQAASAVAPDEILRPWRPTVRQFDVNAGVVLSETGDLGAVRDRHRKLADPLGQDALDVVLPQPEPVGMPGGKAADVQRGPGEPRDLSHLSLREEPIGDAALVEDLDGACVQPSCTRAGKILVRAPLDEGNVDPSQRQLARQHQPRRTASGDHHRTLGHGRTSAGITPAASSGSTSRATDTFSTTRASSGLPIPKVLPSARNHAALPRSPRSRLDTQLPGCISSRN